MSSQNGLIGIVSDTHGLLREEAVKALADSCHILHAGDIGDPTILERLEKICPVTAVRGNVDTAAWGRKLPATAAIELCSAAIYMLHDLKQLDLDPAAAGFGIVISGHSHKFESYERKGVLYVNPGSAGPRRFRLPVTLARLNLQQRPWQPERIDLLG